MRAKLIQLMLIMLFIVLAGVFIIKLTNPSKEIEAMKADDKITVVTTIYPIYLIGLNLSDQIDNLEIKSLINRNTGCLHDYQLTAEDMKVIASADVLVINGGGMESFLEDITANYPDLKIIDASQGLDLLGEAGNYNSHVWLDPKLYEQQIENVRDELINYIDTSSKGIDIDRESIKSKLTQNAQSYIEEVQDIDSELSKCRDEISINLESLQKQQVVIFHEAFAYLAKRMDMTVAFSIELGPDTSLSAQNIAEVVKKIKENKIKYLYTEEQYSTSIPKQIAAETAAKVYVIDSVVTGDGKKDSYLKAMYNNIKILKEASRTSTVE